MIEGKLKPELISSTQSEDDGEDRETKS